MPKRSVHESIGASIELSLGERPELDRFCPAGKRVRKITEVQEPGRPCQQEAPWPWVGIHFTLDGEQKIRDTLDLIYEKKPVMTHDPIRILPCCGPYGCLIQIDLAGPCDAPQDRSGERALADLPGTVDHHYSCVSERLHRHGLCTAWEQREFVRVHPLRVATGAPLWWICRTVRGGSAEHGVVDLPPGAWWICRRPILMSIMMARPAPRRECGVRQRVRAERAHPGCGRSPARDGPSGATTMPRAVPVAPPRVTSWRRRRRRPWPVA